MRIRFNYMYRDGANYKNHGEVIMLNPDNISLSTAIPNAERSLTNFLENLKKQ